MGNNLLFNPSARRNDPAAWRRGTVCWYQAVCTNQYRNCNAFKLLTYAMTSLSWRFPMPSPIVFQRGRMLPRSLFSKSCWHDHRMRQACHVFIFPLHMNFQGSCMPCRIICTCYFHVRLNFLHKSVDRPFLIPIKRRLLHPIPRAEEPCRLRNVQISYATSPQVHH
jgi:hypothetical protein